MSKLIITKDLNNKIIFGPSTSIINELNDKKKDEKKIYILDHCSVGRKNFKNKKINYIVITNFLDLAKKIKTILNVVKNSNEIEIHSIFDAFLFFPIIIILRIFRKEFKIYLRGMVNDNVLAKKKNTKINILTCSKAIYKKCYYSLHFKI